VVPCRIALVAGPIKNSIVLPTGALASIEDDEFRSSVSETKRVGTEIAFNPTDRFGVCRI